MSLKPRARGLVFFLLVCFSCLALAKEAAPLAADEALEKRLVDISSELRCLVCQNESLAASNAELAYDLRREIRAQIKADKSDREIRAFMVERYGDFVLYRPPLKTSTLLLWFGPGVFLLGGLGALFFYLRRRDQALSTAPLSAADARRAEQFLREDES